MDFYSNTMKPVMLRFLGSMNLAIRYVIASFSRAKGGLLVGIGTTALVVGFLALLQATVSLSPLIFLKLAEDSVGENDLVRIFNVSHGITLCFRPLLPAEVCRTYFFLAHPAFHFYATSGCRSCWPRCHPQTTFH